MEVCDEPQIKCFKKMFCEDCATKIKSRFGLVGWGSGSMDGCFSFVCTAFYSFSVFIWFI
jgi:hypothetical protein